MIPKTPKASPTTARRIFSGMLVLIPIPRKRSWKKRVNRILEDAMVEVSEAPILLSPTTYSRAVASGTTENKAKNIQFLTVACNVEDGHRMRIAVKIRPEIKSEAPDTSLELCISTNLVMNITPAAKAIAESIASKSPNVTAVSF
ncbi:MAG: hypothetical protein WBE34_06670 [Candidatus Nitrosopolaris sp.]